MSYNLFGSTAASSSSTGAFNLGTVFTAGIAGQITGVRFYKVAADTSVHIGSLWTIGGTLIEQVTFTGESASGWQQQLFATPVNITPGFQYMICRTCATNFGYNGSAPAITGQPLGNPLGAPASFGHYFAANSVTFPNTSSTLGFTTDVVFDHYTLPSGTQALPTPASIGYVKGISLGGPTSWRGEGSFGRHLNLNIKEQTLDGSPASPCLQVSEPGFFRFRWGLSTGAHTISVLAKQSINGSPRPSMIIKANSGIGIASDIVTSAPSGTGWVTIGPASVTATASGVTWVELWNNYYGLYGTPALFDHIVAT